MDAIIRLNTLGVVTEEEDMYEYVDDSGDFVKLGIFEIDGVKSASETRVVSSKNCL